MMRAIRSLRILRKHWKLTAIAVFSLSIAMALGIVSLSVSNTFLFLSLAAPDSDRLVMIHARSAEQDVEQISYPDFQYFRENNHVFTDIAAAPNSIGLNEDSNFDHREVKVLTRPVSDNYFAVLGIHPLLGQLFAPGDDQGKSDVAVMTYTCWKRLGSDPNIAGKVLAGHTIIGVTPKEFTGSLFGVNGDLLLPLDPSLPPGSRTKRDARQLFLTARLKPGVTKGQAQAEMAALAGQLASDYPKEDKGRTAVITRATLLPPGGLQTAEIVAAILNAVVLLVLLIACGNVANLLLAIAVGRRQEASIKLALGASRGRIIREFLRESAVICGLSGALGYAIAGALITRYSDVTVMLPIFGAYSFSPNLHLDGTVLALTLGLMLMALLATGLAPAFYASSPHLAQVLSGEIVVGGTRKGIRRNILVIVQVAMCTVVLVGMGLCQRNLYNLRQVNPGFSARNLLAAEVGWKGQFPEAKGKELYQELHAKISALPGVEAVSLADNLPLLGTGQETVQLPDGEKKPIAHGVVDADYFSTLGIPMLAGRAFSSLDREGGLETVVVNRKMAEQFWPGQDPLGKTLMVGDPARRVTVVGVAADGKYSDLDETPIPFFYYPLSQHYREGISIIVRTKGDPHQWVQPLAQTIRGFELFSLFVPITFDNWMNLTLLTERITAGIVAGLSALGLLLAVVGLFGAISYSVSERKKELGIRVALGARPAQLLKMVLRQTLLVGGAGVAVGLLLGVGVTMLLRSQFYAIGVVEWTVLVPVGGGMLAVSLAVAYLSARPWIDVDAMEAVRHA